MNSRYLFKCSIGSLLLLSLLACSPRPTATPEVATRSPLAVATNEPLATPVEPLSTQPAPSGPVITHMTSGETIEITFIRMITSTDGWAIGGIDLASDHVFHTYDSGLTWEDVTPPEPAPSGDTRASALAYFKNSTTAWVVYAPAEPGVTPLALNIWFTRDGGETWQVGFVDASLGEEAFNPMFLTFADDMHGWLMVALGAGMSHVYVAVFTTSDGGTTWTTLLDPYTDNSIQSFSKTDMFFHDALTGWLTRDSYGVDPNPHVFLTSDGGLTWERLDLPAPVNLPQLFTEYACSTFTTNIFSATAATFAMKCTDLATFDIQINFQVATTDGGRSWQTLPLPQGYLIGAPGDGLLYFDENNGFAFGRNIYQTTDGGENWTLIKQVSWDGQFSFVNMNEGWAVARGEEDLALVRTTNGGARWDIIDPYIAP